MTKLTAEMLENLRQHFNTAPYPRIPLERSPKNEHPYQLYLHSLVTPYYLKTQKVINTEDKVILDAGCGTGYKALLLASANPGAKIIGIDISEKSVELARDRFRYHGIENAEFHALKLEELPVLGLKFDYINCDEVLYLLPDSVEGLGAMKAVLQDEGIIRFNLHSSSQRFVYYTAQEVFSMLGIMTEKPQPNEVEAVREIMHALKDQVWLKNYGWNSLNNGNLTDESILANHLLRGDRGSNIPEAFKLIEETGLEFIEMVEWHSWQIQDLFSQPEAASKILGKELSELSRREQLYWFELIHPSHRLIDLWCGFPKANSSFLPLDKWQKDDWENATAYIHPQYKFDSSKIEFINHINAQNSIPISYKTATETISKTFETSSAACLLPLWEKPLPVQDLLERWLKINPVHPITLEPNNLERALTSLKNILQTLSQAGIVLLERKD